MACWVVRRLAALSDPVANGAVIDPYLPLGYWKTTRAILTAALVTQLRSERYY